MSLHEANLANLLNAYSIYKGRYERTKFLNEMKKLKENDIIAFKEVPTASLFKRKSPIDVQMHVIRNINDYYLSLKEKERVIKALPKVIYPATMLCDFVLYHKKNGKINKTIIELNGAHHYENDGLSLFAKQLSRDMAKIIIGKEEGIDVLVYKLTSDCEFSPVRDEIMNILSEKIGA
jgi:hypothetical protein